MRALFANYAHLQKLDFLYCLARSAALTLAEWIIASFWPFQVLIH